MPNRNPYAIRRCFRVAGLLCAFALLHIRAYGQAAPGSPITVNAPPRDTTKTNTSSWRDENARIYRTGAFETERQYPDTMIRFFHRRPFLGPWDRDLGNLGSPVHSLFFSPQQPVGPSSGYHVFDAYRFRIDALDYYNTTRPYTVFNYQLGSKLEQTVSVLHTQNIRPNWNAAIFYRKINSPGFFRLQRNNQDFGGFSTNYSSRNLHYRIYAGFVYNKLQHDENGGILGDSFLSQKSYSEREIVPVRFQNDVYSVTRSSVSNVHRDFSLAFRHGYTFGKTDTLYNEDSTNYYFQLKPVFAVRHDFTVSSEKLRYKDLRPDSLRYLGFNDGNIIAQTDSVQMEQTWVTTDNRFALEGTIPGSWKAVAGAGIRTDQFSTRYVTGENTTSGLSTYLFARVGRDSSYHGKWNAGAEGLLYTTGTAIGNYRVDGQLSRRFDALQARLSIGLTSTLSNAPYSYTIYQTKLESFFKDDFRPQSVNQLYGTLELDRYKASAGVRNSVVTDYFYINQSQRPDQYGPAFTVLQAWASKTFQYWHFRLYNEVLFQQVSDAAPVHVPAFMGRHQLSLETDVLNNALRIATGVEARYHSDYYGDGYSPFLNRFYYQTGNTVLDRPELSVFFNFKVKRFRSYFMLDQVQQNFEANAIRAIGYPAQNYMVRFGFSWVLIN